MKIKDLQTNGWSIKSVATKIKAPTYVILKNDYTTIQPRLKTNEYIAKKGGLKLTVYTRLDGSIYRWENWRDEHDRSKDFDGCGRLFKLDVPKKYTYNEFESFVFDALSYIIKENERSIECRKEIYKRNISADRYAMRTSKKILANLKGGEK